MRLLNDVELANTRRKLSELEALYAAHERETGGDEELRDMHRTMKQGGDSLPAHGMPRKGDSKE